MRPGSFAVLAVWSVPLLNLALWIAVAIRPPPPAPVFAWPQPWAILSAVAFSCAPRMEPSASTAAPAAVATTTTPPRSAASVAPSVAARSGRRAAPAGAVGRGPRE
jgi:hypothetical protein